MSLVPHLPPHAEKTVQRFLQAHVEDAQANGVVVGLSGGIDSALCARLARDALGPERVRGLLLPDAAYPAALLEETEAYAAALSVKTERFDVGAVLAAFRDLFPQVVDRVTWGNILPRVRMTVGYTYARDRGLLVMGTGNKSEILMGYFTKFGDGGVDLLPIGDLYKTQVRLLAEKLGLPQAVLDRPPTAGMWEGQTDEQELGIDYAHLDQVLSGLEQLIAPSEIATMSGVAPDEVARVAARVLHERHKRRLPPIPKIGLRTVGIDWRD
ncbi:MAG TPA: NAD+ synthase [Thermoplasmata archaeon]|nr:NAD+ synthase [Thermoplasmata archaeon]